MAKAKPYSLSALAQAELSALAAQQNVPAATLEAHAQESARCFPTSVYYVLSSWFKAQPRHDFEAVIIRRAGAPTISQRMVVDVLERRILSHVECPLDDLDYYAARVILEALIDDEIASTRAAKPS